MRTMKWIGWGCALAMCTVPVMGCQTYRHVVTSQNSDMLEGAPNWARQNAQMPAEDELFFVGVSQEQVTSEAEAVDQAYKDALKKASDYVVVEIVGTDPFDSRATTETSAQWPYRTSPHLGGKLLAIGGVGGYAWSDGSDGLGAGAAPIAIAKIKGPDYKRKSSEHVLNERHLTIIRNSVVSYVNVVDTWSASERFGFSNAADGIAHVNRMRYGELWKAKVLVAAPKKELTKLASRIQEVQIREDDTEYHYRVRAAEMVLDKPTFNFMNNTVFFGQFPPVPFVSKAR